MLISSPINANYLIIKNSYFYPKQVPCAKLGKIILELSFRDFILVKKGLIYFVAFVVILIGGAITVPGFLNWNEYKQEVTDTLYSQTGHKINIDGNLVVKILPSPTVSAEGLTLLDPDGATFLTLDSLNVNVGFFALLAGRIEAESLVLKGGHLSLSRNADGVGNWEFLIPKDNQTAPSDANAMRFDHIGVENLVVNYSDAVLGRADVFENIQAEIKADSTKGPFNIVSSYSYKDVNYAIEAASGRIEPARSFPLSLNMVVAGQSPGINFQGTVVLDGEASAASGNFKGEGGDLAKVVSGLIQLVDGSVPDVFSVNLEKEFKFEAPLILTKARITAKPFSLSAGEVTGEGEFILSPELASGPTANLELKLNSLTVENWLVENPDNSGDANTTGGFSLPLKLNYQLEVPIVNYADELARRNRVKGYIEGSKLRIDDASTLLPGDTEVKLTGGFDLSANPEFRGNVDINSNNIQHTLTWLGQDLSAMPEDRLKRFSLRSVLALSDNGASISGATGQLDGTEYSGNASTIFGDQPFYKANMSLSSFDVESYFPAKPAAANVDKNWEYITKTIEDALAPLANINAEIKLKADKFSIGDARFNNLIFDSKLNENRLHIANFTTSDFKGLKGYVSGTIDGLGGSPRFNLAMDIESPSLAALTRWAGVELPVDVYKLAAVSLTGQVDGTLNQVNVNVNGSAAHANYNITGYLGGLNPRPQQMDVRVNISGDNHQDFIRRMDLPIELHGDGISFTLAGGLKGSPQALDSNLTLDIIGGRVTMVGMLNTVAQTPSFDLNIEANHARLINVAEAFSWGLTPSADNLGRFQLSGNLKAEGGVYQTKDLSGVFGPSQYSLDITYDNSAARPQLNGALNIDGLPLSRFFGNSSTGADAAKRAGGRRWSRTPFELEFMRDLDMNLSFSGGLVSYENYQYKNPQFKATLDKGVLNVTDFKGSMFDGRLVSGLRLDVNNVPRGSISLTLEGASLKQVLEASAAISPATGNLSLRSDIEFSGVSQFDAVKSMKGNVELWAQNGVIKGVDIDRISRRLARLNRLPDFLSLLGSGLAGGETPFGNIRTNFVGERGVFSARNVVADIEGADVEGRMRVDLPQWTMTGTGSIEFNEVELPPTAPQTREVVDAQGQITIEEIPAPPVRAVPPIGVDMAGDIDNPTIHYRTDRLRSFMAERFTSSLLNNVIGGQGGIGGLLGVPQQQAPVEQSAPVDPDVPAGRVDPAEVIVNRLFDLLQPQQQPEPEPEPQADGPN